MIVGISSMTLGISLGELLVGLFLAFLKGVQIVVEAVERMQFTLPGPGRPPMLGSTQADEGEPRTRRPRCRSGPR